MKSGRFDAHSTESNKISKQLMLDIIQIETEIVESNKKTQISTSKKKEIQIQKDTVRRHQNTQKCPSPATSESTPRPDPAPVPVLRLVAAARSVAAWAAATSSCSLAAAAATGCSSAHSGTAAVIHQTASRQNCRAERGAETAQFAADIAAEAVHTFPAAAPWAVCIHRAAADDRTVRHTDPVAVRGHSVHQKLGGNVHKSRHREYSQNIKDHKK